VFVALVIGELKPVLVASECGGNFDRMIETFTNVTEIMKGTMIEQHRKAM
jgi:hypothetical protein